MKASKMLIATLKENPSDAVITSHTLLIRAGMIRKLVAGVYNYLPLGFRVLKKVEKVICEEMDKAGAIQILSSAIQPRELWEESGRWGKYGPELMRFNDRHNREFCLGPTHEEIFTDLVRNEIKSKKNLPINLYQIQTKYRDELRPRFGLMRSREFIMKDAYSFDIDERGLDESYDIMYKAYQDIYARFGLNCRVVLADTGAIGGSGSHQFMAISDVGESNIIFCEHCQYAADEEKATSALVSQELKESLPIKEVDTPNQRSIEEISNFLEVEPRAVVKSLVYFDSFNKQFIMVLVRGDREVNEVKVINALNIAEHELVLASFSEIKQIGSYEGFVGPVGINIPIYVDEEVTVMSNFVVGGNKVDTHLLNINYERDFKGTVCGLRKVRLGDLCPVCSQPLKIERGIEVGQLFKLGTKYSKSMNCQYQDDNGALTPMVMGCYGIGVTRTMSAIIEQYHDDHGIVWPMNVAPYHFVVVPINYNDPMMKEVSDSIYEAIKGLNGEVILDDRSAKPGFKFKDWELIGIPYMITIGKRVDEGYVEFRPRKTMIKEEMKIVEAIKRVAEIIKNER